MTFEVSGLFHERIHGSLISDLMRSCLMFVALLFTTMNLLSMIGFRSLAVCKMRILFCKILLISGLYGFKVIVNGMTFSFLFSGPVFVRNSSDRSF